MLSPNDSSCRVLLRILLRIFFSGLKVSGVPTCPRLPNKNPFAKLSNLNFLDWIAWHGWVPVELLWQDFRALVFVASRGLRPQLFHAVSNQSPVLEGRHA